MTWTGVQYWALVKTVMNIQSYKRQSTYFPAMTYLKTVFCEVICTNVSCVIVFCHDSSVSATDSSGDAAGKHAFYIKVKFVLEQATKVQRGSRCIALLFL